MKNIKSYDNFINESKIPEGYVIGYVKQNVKLAKLPSDRMVYVKALDYTTSGESEKIEIIIKDNIKTQIVKSYLDVKF